MATDYISRDYAVENMENFPFDTEHDKNAAIHLVRELVPAADVVPAPRWIPVTERFPPLDKEVLVFAIGLPEWGFEGKTTTAIAYRLIASGAVEKSMNNGLLRGSISTRTTKSPTGCPCQSLRRRYKMAIEYVPRDAAKAVVCEACEKPSCPELWGKDCSLVGLLNDIPAADVQPVVHGEWEEIAIIPDAYDIAGVITWASKMRCQKCGFTTYAIEGGFSQYNFCPNCGADMREKKEGAG